MKTCKNCYLILSCFISICIQFSQALLYAQVSYSVKFLESEISYSKLIGEDKITYDKITILNLPQNNQIGIPNLPVKYVRLLIPSNSDPNYINIVSDLKIQLPGYYTIFPCQHDIPTSIYPVKMEFIAPDSKVYNSDDTWPVNPVEIENHGYFDGSNHIVTIRIIPFQYYPKSGRLFLFTNIDFNLELTNSTRNVIQPYYRSEKNQLIYDNVLQSIVDNPWDISRFQQRPILNKKTLAKTTTMPTYEFVIITSSDLISSLGEFISWKRRVGFDIGVVSVDDIKSNYWGDEISGIDDDDEIYPEIGAGKIRQYLYDAYVNGTVWAFLVGDYTKVPIRYGCGWDKNQWTNWDEDDYKIPTDIYFSDFTGDWQVDGNIWLGQPYKDNPDYIPEIFVGRLLCNSTIDIIKWVNKVFIYEQDPGKGDLSYLTKSFMMQSDHLQQREQAQYLNPYLPSAFSNTIWQELPSSAAALPTFPSGSEVVNKMNECFGLNSWLAHGAPIAIVAKADSLNTKPRWVINPIDSFDNETIETGNGLDCMTNYNYPSIIYSIGCDNAPFDDYNPKGFWPDNIDNLAEAFTIGSNSGGVVFLGNSRYGWVDYSYLLYKQFLDQLTSGNTYLGSAELISKQNYSHHYLRYSHNLIGSPEIKIWTATPQNYTGISIIDNGSSISVNTGVSGSNICACSVDNGTSFHQLTSDVSNCTFYTSTRPLYITVTKNNYLPYCGITGGTFTQNHTWNGKLNIIGNIVVSAGKTLSIQPGTSLSFNNEKGLTINGSLSANGSPTDRITFARNGTSGTWSGIKFNSGSSGTIRHCDISYASTGIWCNNTSAPKINNNTISNCSSYGIHLYNSAAYVDSNTVTGSGYTGIYSQYTPALLYLYHNTVTGNQGYGLNFYSSEAWLAKPNPGGGLLPG
jgi:parallel beta-helix repeat protein